MSSEKLKKVLEKLNNIVEATRVSYFNEDSGAVEYYFYYNDKQDPVLVQCPFGEYPDENSIGVTLPSSVHQDLDLRPHSTVTEGQLAKVIQSYQILTEMTLKKSVKNGRVIRKRVLSIKKPKRISTLKNKIDGKKASLFSKTAVANVKRKRSNNVRDVLNLDKQANDLKENKEKLMNRFDLTRGNRKLHEIYITYPAARSIAIDIMNTLITKKLPSYNLKYPSTGTCTIDRRGYCIDYGMMNQKWMAKESMEDAIAKDIMGRFSRGEELDPAVAKVVTLHHPVK